MSAVVVGVALAALIGVLATRDPATTRSVDSPLLGKPAPALAGPSLLDGETFDLADQSGRWVLVNFFATWCVPCQREHDDLLRFTAAHASAGDARVVSVVFGDERRAVRRFFERNGGDWPVVDDTDGRVATDFGVTGVPESYLVGPEGSVRARIVGGLEFSKLEALLDRAAGRG